MIDMDGYEKTNIGGKEFSVRTKRIHQKDLTPECWSIQVWGLPYCRTCEYLATEDCEGYDVRKKILSSEFPSNGLPDVGPE